MIKREKADFDVLGRIEKERAARGWTEYELAVNSGMTQSTLSTWRSRDLQPSVASLEKICKGLGISLSEFFSDSADSVTVTEEQRHMLDLFNSLDPGQKEALIALLDRIVGR